MDKEAAKNGKCKIMCKIGLTGLHNSYVTFAFCGSLLNLFSLLAFLFLEFDTSLTFHMLILCLGSFPL